MIRKTLTGNWCLKRKLFGGFDVMVESTNMYAGGSPEWTSYRKATDSDLIKLDIKII